MKRILVTGANKGIGLAIVEAILREQPQYSVILGTRDIQRGQAARDRLLSVNAAWSDRIDVLELDVSSDRAVAEARASVLDRDSDTSPPLFGLVNNAGLATGTLGEILDVNVHGIRRMCQAFVAVMPPGGRIVKVTSAAGPNFVARCNKQRQDFFVDPEITWEQLEQFMTDCQQLEGDGLESLGIGSDSQYGLSKACANSYTLGLARRHPHLLINACTPGFIETDLGTAFLGDRSPAEAGMKTPAEGARVVMHLLFGHPEGTGHYYGSDALRSPMHCYRAPGTPAFTGT